MDELILQTLIKANYAGSLTETSVYVSLVIQATAVIIGGIILWRGSVALQKKKMAQRSRNTYFETPYAKGWKRK
ncbi:MAG: hypothetical protein P8N52_03795 [Crocinitomicaceae bacterium]|nr:hypothetical protein [Crocinitomicaceae bacterium]MDG1777142.1 hypothetical protein [Crocinitomicaceae bacterium]